MKPVALAYLGSYLLSLLGNGIAAVALPLIVLQVTGSALGAGAVAAATALPAVLVGLGAGVLIDRINRRTSSVVTDLISAAAIAALPLADLVWGLDLGWFILLGILGSFGDVPGLTAREVLLPAVARHGGVPLERLIGLREALGAVALLAGPAAAGVLMTVFDSSTVLWVTAATSAAAALLTLCIPHRVGRRGGDAPSGKEPLRVQLAAGWAALRASPLLAGTTVLTVGMVVVIGGLQGLILPLYFSELGQPGQLGFVLTAMAIGTLAGAGGFAALGTRVPRRLSLNAGLTATTAGFGLIALLPSPWAVFGGGFLLGLAAGALNGVLGVLLVERTPDAVRGRVTSIQNAFVTIAAPLGIGLAGVVAEYGSAVAAGLAVVAVWVVSLVVVMRTGALTDVEPEGVRT